MSSTWTSVGTPIGGSERHSCLRLPAVQGAPGRMAMESAGHAGIRPTPNAHKPEPGWPR
jgi:hypothetical protein